MHGFSVLQQNFNRGDITFSINKFWLKTRLYRFLGLFASTSEHIRFFFTFYRAMLCMRGTSHRPVFVSVSVRNRRSTETANRRITQTTPHDSASEVTTLWRYTNLFIIIIIRRPIICTVKMLAVMVDLVSSCDRQTDRHTTVLRSPQ